MSQICKIASGMVRNYLDQLFDRLRWDAAIAQDNSTINGDNQLDHGLS
jgi:hypothetical protein